MIYFDNAATTFPKPPSVLKEVLNCMESYCGNPGRSGHRLAMKAAEKIYECREAVSSLFGVSTPTNVVFTPNTTYALNIAINAFAHPKTHVLISDIEHNSVLRTVAHLRHKGIDYDIFKTDPHSPLNTLSSIKAKLRRNTAIIVCNHVSNICGITNPIYEIGLLCKEKGLKFIVDGAQSVGTHKINIPLCNIDALCCPGHKGLFGPQGTGFVIFSDKYYDAKGISSLSPFIYGGNGFNSADSRMPDILPERYEGGTINTPGIVGLSEGIDFVKTKGEENIFKDICTLYNRAADMVKSLPNTVTYCTDLKESSCLLFNIKKQNSDLTADLLSQSGICVRGGLHCSPLCHQKLGTESGAVRLSFSCFNTLSELDIFYSALKNIVFEI